LVILTLANWKGYIVTDKSLSFTLVLKSTPVEMEIKAGEKVQYALKELSGSDRDAFLKFTTSKITQNEKGEDIVKDPTGIQSCLLARALYDQDGKSVTQEVIESYPATILSTLFDVAKELSGLEDEVLDLDEAKEALCEAALAMSNDSADAEKVKDDLIVAALKLVEVSEKAKAKNG
jgi:hypothetical protein